MGIFIDVLLDLATNVATMIASKSDAMSRNAVNGPNHNKLMKCEHISGTTKGFIGVLKVKFPEKAEREGVLDFSLFQNSRMNGLKLGGVL